MKKVELIYVYDALCSWCYAIDKEIKVVQEKFKDQLKVNMISGGMFIDDPSPRLLDLFPIQGIRDAYARVSQLGAVPITEKYLDGLIEKENYILDSRKTAIGFAVYKSMVADRTKDLDFMLIMQEGMYIDGLNPNTNDYYKQAAEKSGLDPELFIKKMEEPQFEEDARRDFKYARDLKVTSYPQIFLKTNDTQYFLLSKGYSNSDILVERIAKVLAEMGSEK